MRKTIISLLAALGLAAPAIADTLTLRPDAPSRYVVVSGDTLPQKKPHPAPLLHAGQVLGVAPARALMVGDSIHDVEAARAAGFQVACVTYGYNHGMDIRDARPDAVIGSLLELRELLGPA